MIVRLVANARPRPGKRRRQNGWMVVIKKCRDVIMLAACEKKKKSGLKRISLDAEGT